VNAGALAGSNLWRIAISFVLQLLIARRLGVEGLGHYTIAMAYLNVCQVLTELGMPTLLVRDLAHAPQVRRAYFFLSLRVQMIAGLVVWAGLVGLAFLLPLPPDTRASLWLVGASLPFYAVTAAGETLFQAAERMELLMGVEIFINTLIVIASLGVLWLGGSVPQLVGVIVVTQAISAALCLLLTWRQQLLAAPQVPISLSPLLLWRRVSPFFGLSIADVLLQRLDILLLSVVGGPLITGIYSAAYNIVRVLVKLIQGFWKALYPTLSRLHHQDGAKYVRLAGLSLRYGLTAVLPCAALATGVATELMHLMYAEGYAEAAPVFQRLVWIAPVVLVEFYAVTLLMVEHRAPYSVAAVGVHLGALVLLLPVLTTSAGAVGAAWAALLAALLGAAAGVIALRRLRIAVATAKLAPMLLATLLALVASVWLPLPWLARLGLGALLYLLLVRLMGIVEPVDYQLFRRALRSTEV
jgi:O-antigen/teichoic acid export membrane protein